MANPFAQRFPRLFGGKTAEQLADAIVRGAGPKTEVLDHYGYEAIEFLQRGGDRARARAAHGDRLSYQQIAYLIDNNWLARKIVRWLPTNSFGAELVFTEQKDLEDWQKVNASPNTDDGAFLTAAIWANAFGKCLLLKGYPYSGALDQPLGTALGEIEFLEPIPAPAFTVRQEDLCRDENNAARFGLPEYYRITKGKHRFGGQSIHYSRFVEFIGPTATDPDNMRDRIAGVHLSILDPVWKVIQEFGLSWGAVSLLIQQASIPVFRMKGAIKGLAANAKEVLDRMDIMTEQMSITKAVVLDADEEEDYERKAVSFSDLPAVMQQLAIKLSAASDIGLGELFGRIVSGLGDSEKGEENRTTRKIDNYRTRTLAPRIREIVGAQDVVQWSFAPVVTPDKKAEFEIRKGYFDVGALTDQEMRAAAEKDCGLEHVENWEPVGLPAAAPATPANPAKVDPAKPDAPAPDDAGVVETESGVKVELAPTTISKLLSANEARGSMGKPPAKRPDGSPDPDGNLPVDLYYAKKLAEIEAAQAAAAATPAPSPVVTDSLRDVRTALLDEWRQAREIVGARLGNAA